VREVSGLKRELDSLNERANQLAREMDRVAAWGDVSTSILAEVERGSGHSFRFFEAPAKEAQELLKEFEYIRIHAPKGKIRVALVLEDGEKAPELPAAFQEIFASGALSFSDARGSRIDRVEKESNHEGVQSPIGTDGLRKEVLEGA